MQHSGIAACAHFYYAVLCCAVSLLLLLNQKQAYKMLWIVLYRYVDLI